MNRASHLRHAGRLRQKHRGMVLVSSLLLLVVVTILAMALFHSFGLDEKIAGNTREKQRALQAAVSAQQYGEWWLSNGQTISNVTCSGPSTTTPQVCLNTLPTAVTGGSGLATGNVALLPWTNSLGASLGYTYTPPNAGTYWQSPVFYISYLGIGTGSNGATGSVYQIDSVGYGGSPNTAAVVESTYIVQTSTQNLDGG
jgi:type IV pilus assembly protein PilX